MRIAILVSAGVAPGLHEKIQAGLHPRQDFLALAEALEARLITPLAAPPGMGLRVSRPMNIFRSAWAAFRQHRGYDVIISDMDRVGLTLALLFKLTGTRKRHILICHGKITRPYDINLVRKLRLDEYIDCFVCYGPAVAGKLRNGLQLSDSQVTTVRHAADQDFWRPAPVAPHKLIVSAGMLHRDYPTLVEAVRGQDTSLAIAAHSPWVAGRKTGVNPGALPPNVQITRCDYTQLRGLYAQALCVAIPLTTSRGQSGSLVAYEAMSMGKPVLVTRTEGQDGLDIIQEGETGYYLDPGDIAGWRDRINYLCANPQVAISMGRKARQAVEGGMNLDGYVTDMVSVVRSITSQDRSWGRREDIAANSVGA